MDIDFLGILQLLPKRKGGGAVIGARGGRLRLCSNLCLKNLKGPEAPDSHA